MNLDRSKPRPPFGDARPEPTRPRLWVETWAPSSSRPTRAVLLNDWIAGFYTHFLPGETHKQDRTKPCLIELGGCAWHALVKNRRWKGYIGAALPGMRRPVLLEITEGAWESCLDLQRLDGELRGWEFDCWRKTDSTRAPMFMRKVNNLHKTPGFPKVDTCAVLARLWQVEAAELVAVAGTDDGKGGWGNPTYTDLHCGDAPPPARPAPAPAPAEEVKKMAGRLKGKKGK
jgi:hypothetical protein